MLLLNSIEVKDLTRRFGDFTAVDKISFSVKEGEIFGLLGPNGAGKTTTIKMLTTMLKPTSGKAEVCGYEATADPDSIRSSFGIVFQDPSLDNQLTGYENLDFHARFYGISKERKNPRIKEVLKLVGLENKKSLLVKNYSGGMCRRLEIARGLIHYPKVLFLDEPTLGLDAQARHTIWDYIKKLNQREGITIFLTTHYMEEADFLCQRVAIMDSGKILTLDSPENLKNAIHQDIISLEVSDGQKALETLREFNWIKEAKLHNGFLDLRVESGERKIPLLVALLQKENILITSVNLHRPTLEDVFLSFTGSTIREEEATPLDRARMVIRAQRKG